MAKVRKTQTDFSRGETSPSLDGRLDLDSLYKGLKRISNFIPKPQGGLTRRDGTEYIATVADVESKLVEYEYDETRYILLFQPNIIYIYKGKTKLDIEISTEYTATDVSNMVYAQAKDYLVISTGRHFQKLSRLSEEAWTIEDIEQEDGPYLDQNESDVHLTATTISDRAVLEAFKDSFVEADVGKYVEFKEDNDHILAKILEVTDARNAIVEVQDNIMTEPDKQAKIAYSSPNVEISNNVAVFDRYSVGNYIRIADNTWHLVTAFTSTVEVAVDAAVTMIAAGSLAEDKTRLYDREIIQEVEADDPLFTVADVGLLLRMNFSEIQVWGKITQLLSDTTVRVDANDPLPRDIFDGRNISNNGRTKKFRLGAWGSTRGYPKALCFYRDRLVAYGSTLQPNTFWSSSTQDYFNFAPTEIDSTVTALNAITAEFNSTRIANASFLMEGKVLFLGTNSGVWQISPSYLSDSINPENTRGTKEDSFGADRVRPEFVDSGVIFVQRHGKKIRELYFNFNDQSYISNDLNVLAEHLFENDRIVEITYQAEPHGLIWVRTQNGLLFSLTYSRRGQKLAWARHDFGGTVKSICITENNVEGRDNLYLIVKRGSLVTLEVMTSSCLLDCSSTGVSGYDRFEGQLIWAIIDNEVYQEVMVINGSITIPFNYTTVVAGLFHDGEIGFHSPDMPMSDFTTTHGSKKRITDMLIKVQDSMSFDIEYDGNKTEVGDRPFGTFQKQLPYSADHFISIGGIADYSPVISLMHRTPTPLNVLATTISFDVEST